MTAVELAFRCGAAALGRSRLLVLTYHRVLAEPDLLLPGEPDAATFRRQMRFLQRNFQVLSLPEALLALFERRLPARAAAVSFDDGYANNFEVALPILAELGLPATFFVASGYLDGGRMWNDTVIESVRRCRGGVLDLSDIGLDRHPTTDDSARRTAIRKLLQALKHLPPDERAAQTGRIAGMVSQPLPDDLMMSSQQVRQLSEQGMDIGGHTVSHPILARLGDAEVRQEVAQNRDHLTRLTGKPPQTFAYPNGTPGKDFLPQHPQIVLDCGYRYALTTVWGAASAACEPGLIPRIGLWSRTPAALAVNLLKAYR